MGPCWKPAFPIAVLLALATRAEPAGGYTLRFYGNGVNDIDRVKIRVDDPTTSLPGPPADVGADDFTLDFWMRASASENTAPAVSCGWDINWIYGNIVFDRDRFNQDRKFGLSLAGGRFVFGVSGDGTGDRTICGTTNVLDDQWHHVAVQRRRSDGWMWLFVDGALEAQADGPDGDVSYPDDGVPGSYCGGPCDNSDPFLVIAAEKHDAGASFPSYGGYIDEVRLSNVLRYGGAFSRPSLPFVPDTATVALYHLDEGSGNVVGDSSGASGGPSPGERRFGGSPTGPVWTTETAPLAEIGLSDFASGITQIVGLGHAGDGSGRLFIVRQSGQILIHDGSQVLPTPFLDLGSLVSCCGEQGLLGLAFHPQYAANGHFFVHYTDVSGNTVVARYQVSGSPNLANPGSGLTVLTVGQPYTNHNGGQLAFGPDGYLYVALGDGGSGGDPQNRAQNLGSLLGKILRLDVDALPYTIPPDNPFVSNPAARDEIWAWGLRNPWRFSFDRSTGDLFIGDVGQGTREEIDFQPASSSGGDNYGWRLMEGSLCFNPATGCNEGSLTLPILEYDHSLGCSVTGGYRYRGALIPGLAGVYLYGDYCNGRIWGGSPTGVGTWGAIQLLDTAYRITAFGEDEAGELFVVDYDSGVYRIVPTGPPALAVGDASVAEGDAGGVSVVFPVTLLPPSSDTVTVDWATADGTATAGADYTPDSDSLSFTPGATSRSITVSVLGDLLDETDETFLVNLSSPTNAVLTDPQGQATILDDDPTPLLSIDDVSRTEGDAGSTNASFTVSISSPSALSVSSAFSTADNTALAGVDYTATASSVVFPPASTTPQTIHVPVLGDIVDEPHERFSLVLSSPANAFLADSLGIGTILDDDGGSFPIQELAHGSRLRTDLQAQPGPVADRDLYVLEMKPYSSFEVLVDEASGDVGSDSGPRLERLAPDLVATLASSAPTGAGPGRSLRLRNTGAILADAYVAVSSNSCTTLCGADDTYRIRARETTASIPRFNNSGSQITVLVLQNPTAGTIAGDVHFWSGAGALLATQPFSLGPHATFILATSSLPALAGQSGALTINHDGPYGQLAGKTVALEPATGFSFDSPLVERPR